MPELIDRISRLRQAQESEPIEKKPVAERVKSIQQAEPGLSGLDIASAMSLKFAQGITFGFGEEMSAGARALWDRIEGEDYSDAYLRIRDNSRKRIAEFEGAYPKTALATEIAGGLTIPAVGPLKAVGSGATTGAKIARGATVGAITGAAYGAGQAEEITDIPLEATKGGLLGATVGGAIPAVASGARALYGAARSAFAPESAANRRIAQIMAQDQITPQQVVSSLEEATKIGKPATIADVGGEAVKRELEAAVQQPGAAAEAAEQFLRTRNKQQLSRISSDLIKGTGVESIAVEDAIEKTMKIRTNAAKPLYEKAMQFNAELSDDIVEAYNSVINTPLGKQALKNAKKILNVENFDDAPLMERIDAVKRGLDDVRGSAIRSGKNAVANKAKEAKSELIDLVDEVNPDYKKARNVWETESNYLDAIDRGRDILKPALTAAKLKIEYSKLSGPEREAFRIGAVDSVITRMRQQSAQEPNLIKILRSPEIKDKLMAIMDEEKAAKFENALSIEESMFRTASQVRGGSPTARRQAVMAEQAKELSLFTAIGSIIDSAISPIRTIFIRGIPAVGKKTRDKLLQRQNEIVANRLLRSDPDELMNIDSIKKISGSFEGAFIPSGIIATEGQK